MTTTTTYLPAGTRVLNANDGEPGAVLNGYATGPNGQWTEYEVETRYGIELWKTADFITLDEANAAIA